MAKPKTLAHAQAEQEVLWCETALSRATANLPRAFDQFSTVREPIEVSRLRQRLAAARQRLRAKQGKG